MIPNKREHSIAVIYLITCMVNGKIYVGSTKNFTGRKATYKWAAKQLKPNCQLVVRAMHKHGWDVFQFSVLEEVIDVIRLQEREQYWIDALQPFGEKGYNIEHKANNKDRVLSDPVQYSEQRRQIALRYGQQTRERSSKPVYQIDTRTLKIINCYPSAYEADQAVGIAVGSVNKVCRKNGPCHSAAGFYWVYQDTYKKEGFIVHDTSQAYRRALAWHIKPIAQVDNDNNVVKIWDSGVEASVAMGVHVGTINNSVRRNKRCKGYKWRFVDDDKIIANIRAKRATS